MRDPYQVLGVGRGASQDDIKATYRRLAKAYHPDLHRGDPDFEKKFKDVGAAYALLSDPTKRARFDRGEIDADGNEQRRSHSRGRAGAGRAGAGAGGAGAGGAGAGGARGQWRGPFDFDTDDLFEQMFREGRQRRQGVPPQRGADANYMLRIDFIEAAQGCKKRITLIDGDVLDLNVPAGTEDGQILRLKGKGRPGLHGGESGDGLVEVKVKPHAFFERRGRDIHLDLPVTLPEAVLGASILVPTLDGKVALKVPKGSNTGTVLRLKARGMPEAKDQPPGDQYVRLQVMLPERPDKDLAAFLEKWSAKKIYDVRGKVGLED
jgi:DnaJ-class molecular chaperone